MKKLFTEQDIKRLKEFPYGSQDGKKGDAEVVLYVFNPYGRGTWCITEFVQEYNGTIIAYGYCNIYEWEYGTVSLNELESIKFMGGKLGLERDKSNEGKTLGQVLKIHGVTL